MALDLSYNNLFHHPFKSFQLLKLKRAQVMLLWGIPHCRIQDGKDKAFPTMPLLPMHNLLLLVYFSTSTRLAQDLPASDALCHMLSLLPCLCSSHSPDSRREIDGDGAEEEVWGWSRRGSMEESGGIMCTRVSSPSFLLYSHSFLGTSCMWMPTLFICKATLSLCFMCTLEAHRLAWKIRWTP